MSRFIGMRLRGLADEVSSLKDRVRTALAVELAGAIAGAVQDVVRAVVAGRPVHVPTTRSGRQRPGAWDDDPDAWADEPDEYEAPRAGRVPVRSSDRTAGEQVVAMATGVQVARWWLARNGTFFGAAGAGLVVAVTGFFGGATTRAGLMALGVTADLLAVTDSLGNGTGPIEDD